MLEGVVPLRERHRARVEPGVDHFVHAPHVPAALTAWPCVGIDVRLVGIEIGWERFPPAPGQLLVGADYLAMLAVRIAFPYVERRAPVAVARQGPVDVVLEPFAEPPAAYLGRMPIDLGIDLQHPHLHRGGADEPRAAGVVDERRIAAPAVRIAV